MTLVVFPTQKKRDLSHTLICKDGWHESFHGPNQSLNHLKDWKLVWCRVNAEKPSYDIADDAGHHFLSI